MYVGYFYWNVSWAPKSVYIHKVSHMPTKTVFLTNILISILGTSSIWISRNKVIFLLPHLHLQSEVKYFKFWNSWNTSGIFLFNKENTTWNYSLIFIFAFNVPIQTLTLLVWTRMFFVTLYRNILSLLILHKILLH